MTINARNIIVAILLIATAFASGRYSVTQSHTKSIEINSEVNRDKNIHTQTTTVTTKSPDGAVKTVTSTDTTSTISTVKKEISKEVDQTAGKRSMLNVSLLAAYNFQSPSEKLVYGLSVSKEVLGPITAGVFGLSNGTIGLSIGLNF